MIKILRCALWLLPLGLIPLACSEEPIFVDNTCTPPVACEELADCYSEGNYELGTECRNSQCLCPDWEGMSPLPCCLKGSGPNDCKRQCRPIEDCEPEPCATGTGEASASGAGGEGTGGTGGAGGAGGTGGDGGAIVPGCVTAADCTEKPADARCGEVECISGECRLTSKPIEKISSQIRGDCVSTYCDGQGATIVLPDGEDDYNDGKECTFDTCENLTAENVLLPNGSPCPETGAGVCYEGKCVECTEDNNCANGFACDALLCVPAACWQNKNNMADPPLETGVDCGGQCYPCFNLQTCKTAFDCVHGVCAGGKCALPTHSDGVKNDNETGIDCGCASCAPCQDGFECETGDNCQSLVCWAGKCQAPKCDDGRKNGDETGIDCGGACNNACP